MCRQTSRAGHIFLVVIGQAAAAEHMRLFVFRDVVQLFLLRIGKPYPLHCLLDLMLRCDQWICIGWIMGSGLSVELFYRQSIALPVKYGACNWQRGIVRM